MNSTYEEEIKPEGMSNAAKLGILAGTLGLTGLIAWVYSDKGPMGASKKAGGPGRTYLAGGGETTTSMAAKYNAVGHESDLTAANPTLVWPLTGGEHVVIPDSWALLYSAMHAAGAPQAAAHHSADWSHGHQVGLAAAKLPHGAPITANVSTRGGGAELWNGTSWVKTSPDFQKGWHAGFMAGRHGQAVHATAPHAPTSPVAAAHA